MKIKILLFCVCFISVPTAAQTGGQFAVTQSVIAGGGGNSGGGNFAVTGTNAQPSAGTNSTGGQFAVNGGFWQAFLAPTAAQVSVSGRVTTARGGGIANARVKITNQTGQTRTALTGSFGYFRFEEVTVGETYILTVVSKRFQFNNGTQVLYVTDKIGDLVFVADWQ